MLEKVNNIEDVKKLKDDEKIILSKEIREYIIKHVSKTGGHLASNLGIVELTIALHSCFNVPEDKIIWDVGHQIYAHKIITGRKDKIDTLRQLNGISGFPNTKESELDCFDTGHSSTSISVALGMARSLKLQNKSGNVIAVIGDGALTGGIAFEALNDAGASNDNIIVILNDNEMSIGKNVGGLSKLLSKIRTKNIYRSSNNIVKKIVRKIPYIGEKIISFFRRIKHGIKQLIISNMFFEDMGFTYLGPIDGHDIEKLEYMLEKSKNIDGPILIHVATIKGKGYKPAEDNPSLFHGISKFDIETGNHIEPNKKDYSKIIGNKLIELAKKNKNIVGITAAMRDGVGLKEFSLKYPDRFFDVGIAEQHALTMAAGMAKTGLKPYVLIYSSFLQRGYDQIIHDICIQKLPVVIGIDRAGVVGQDGETHQGMFDLSFLSAVPNLNIFAPKDFKELEDVLEFSITFEEPLAIRYPRGEEGKIKFENYEKIQIGKGEMLNTGEDITIIAIGNMVERAVEVCKLLKEKDIHADVINSRFLKPIDEDLIIKSINKTKNVITIEDGTLTGGLYTKVLEVINKNNLKDIDIKGFGYPDKFIEHGKVEELEKLYGLNKESILDAIDKIHT